MPNWCNNEFTVAGPVAGVRQFRDRARSTGPQLSFAAFLPEPDYADPALARSDWWPSSGTLLTAGYAWRLAHWGPKWEVNKSRLQFEEDGRLVYTFDTPYGPPLPWLASVADEHPELHFTIDYQESMNNFRGRQVYSRGRFQEGIEGQYFERCKDCGAEYVLPFPNQRGSDEVMWCGRCVQGHELIGAM